MKLRKTNFFKGILLALMAVLIIGTVSGCGKKSEAIKVGSKEFTEQLLLGQITILALKDAGFDIVDKTNVAGSDKVRQALVQGDFDLYWEYTGTAWLAHLKHENPITDSKEAYEKVKDEDSKNNLAWLNYAPFNNTYTLMMRKEQAAQLGLKSISDLAKYVKANPGKIIFAGDAEFSIRPDGLPGVEEMYDFNFGEDNIKIMDLGITYKALKDQQVNVAMGFATDGRIAAYDLINLEDDKKFFPVYNPSPVVRKEVIDKNPKIKEVLDKISSMLDTETMTKLNYEVDINEREPKEVAEQWLKGKGLIK